MSLSAYAGKCGYRTLSQLSSQWRMPQQEAAAGRDIITNWMSFRIDNHLGLIFGRRISHSLDLIFSLVEDLGNQARSGDSVARTGPTQCDAKHWRLSPSTSHLKQTKWGF